MKTNSKKPQKSKGRKNYRVREDRSMKDRDERKEEGYTKSETNDPAWYAQTPELMRLSASIPFSNAAGVPFSLNTTASGTDTYQNTNIIIPGLLTLEVIPCPHVTPYANDPLNVAANAMLSFVVHANSRNLSYNAPDLMIYNIAMGNVYAYINFMMRVYGTAQIFSTFNRNLPRMLTVAQGVNYDDLMAHLADFRYGINLLINKAASFSAPADMPYFKRLAFMFSGIYSEGETIKDQLYMYTPAGFMQYSETASTTGGSLTFARWDTLTQHTVDQMLTFGNNLLNAIITSEDMNVMSGDILKAYGQEGLLKLATMPEVYTVLPTTDLAVLEQMQNANYLGMNANQLTVEIKQVQSGTQGPVLSGGVSITVAAQQLEAATNSFILNTILTDPQPADVMERTRMMFGVQDVGDGAETFYATEIIKSAYMWLNQNGIPVQNTMQPCVLIGAAPPVASVQGWIYQHCLMETFKFHPKVFYFNFISANVWKLNNFAMDTDNYTVFDFDTLDRMNSAAIMSLFNSTRINIIR